MVRLWQPGAAAPAVPPARLSPAEMRRAGGSSSLTRTGCASAKTQFITNAQQRHERISPCPPECGPDPPLPAALFEEGVCECQRESDEQVTAHTHPLDHDRHRRPHREDHETAAFYWWMTALVAVSLVTIVLSSETRGSDPNTVP